MTVGDAPQLAALVKSVLDAEESNRMDGSDVNTIVRQHVEEAVYAAVTPDVDMVLASIINHEARLP